MFGYDLMIVSKCWLVSTRPFITTGRTSPDQSPPPEDLPEVGNFLRKLAINIVISFLTYGCAAPSSKIQSPPTQAAQTAIQQPHRHPANRHPPIGTARSTHHHLSNAENDRLFR